MGVWCSTRLTDCWTQTDWLTDGEKHSWLAGCGFFYNRSWQSLVELINEPINFKQSTIAITEQNKRSSVFSLRPWTFQYPSPTRTVGYTFALELPHTAALPPFP